MSQWVMMSIRKDLSQYDLILPAHKYMWVWDNGKIYQVFQGQKHE